MLNASPTFHWSESKEMQLCALWEELTASHRSSSTILLGAGSVKKSQQNTESESEDVWSHTGQVPPSVFASAAAGPAGGKNLKRVFRSDTIAVFTLTLRGRSGRKFPGRKVKLFPMMWLSSGGGKQQQQQQQTCQINLGNSECWRWFCPRAGEQAPTPNINSPSAALRHRAVMIADRSAVDRVTFTSNTLDTPTSLSTPQMWWTVTGLPQSWHLK